MSWNTKSFRIGINIDDSQGMSTFKIVITTLFAALIFRKLGRNRKVPSMLAVMIATGILAETFMVLGYFFYVAVILGYSLAAAGAIIRNLGQGISGIIGACIIVPVLHKSSEIIKMMNRK